MRALRLSRPAHGSKVAVQQRHMLQLFSTCHRQIIGREVRWLHHSQDTRGFHLQAPPPPHLHGHILPHLPPHLPLHLPRRQTRRSLSIQTLNRVL